MNKQKLQREYNRLGGDSSDLTNRPCVECVSENFACNHCSTCSRSFLCVKLPRKTEGYWLLNQEVEKKDFDRAKSFFIHGDEVGKAPSYSETSPEHYKNFCGTNKEVIEIIEFSLTLEEYRGYLKGNAIKYTCRAGYKGDPETDLKKRDVYLTWLEESNDV